MSPLRRLWLQLKHSVTPYRELRRPQFPVDPRFLEKRGEVNDVKPVRVSRSDGAPLDYDRSPPPV